MRTPGFRHAAIFSALLALTGGAMAYEGPMKFSTFRPCDGAGKTCAVQILAEGQIEADTAKKLDQFIKVGGDKTHTQPSVRSVSFDSMGGSWVGGVQLGRFIRSHKMNTNLEPYYSRMKMNHEEQTEVFLDKVKCVSACVVAFAGGVVRRVDPAARMGLYPFVRAAKNVGVANTENSVEDFAAHLNDMGVKKTLIDVASLGAVDSIIWLSESQLVETRLDNSQPYAAPWFIYTSPAGTATVGVRQEISSGREVRVEMGFHEGRFLVLVTTELNRSLVEEDRVQLFPVGGMPAITLRTAQQTIKVTSVRAWERSDTGATASFRAVGSITPDEAKSLMAAKSIRVDDGFPTDIADLSASTELGIENLKSGLNLALQSR